MTLQEQYNLIKEGKGNKTAFLKEAKRNHSDIISNITSFEDTVNILTTKNVINENTYYADLQPVTTFKAPNKQDFENKFADFLAEAAKKGKSANDVAEIASHNFDYKDKKNIDNQVGQEVLNGVYLEVQKNPKITKDEALKTASKNLAKDPLYYVKEGQFGIEGLGYEEPVQEEVTGKYAASGYSEKLKKVVKEALDLSGGIGGISTTGNPNSFAAQSGAIINQMMNDMEGKINEMGMYPGDTEITFDEPLSSQPCPECGMKDCDCDHDTDGHEEETDITVVPLGEEDEMEAAAEADAISDEEGHEDIEDVNIDEEAIVADEEPAIKIPSKSKNKKQTLQKRMSEIEKLGTALALEAKMEAIDEEITLREDQLSMLDENESMAALMDPKKLKEIKNEIKLLEKAKSKYQKMHEKASKAAKKNDE